MCDEPQYEPVDPEDLRAGIYATIRVRIGKILRAPRRPGPDTGDQAAASLADAVTQSLRRFRIQRPPAETRGYFPDIGQGDNEPQ